MPIISTKIDQPFKRVNVDYLVMGGARISWEIDPRFHAPAPFTFQLSVNRNADEPNNWQPVGDPVVNSYFGIDSNYRLYAKNARLSYRIGLTDGANNNYISPIATILGNLTLRQHIYAQAIIRRAKLQRTQLPKIQGWLFKRKLFGTTCDCVDELTGTVTDPDCSDCFGTGKVSGYWQGTSELLYDLSPATRETKLDDQLNRGAVDDATIRQGVLVGEPFVETKDLFVLQNSDQRYTIKAIKHLAEIDNIPLISQITLALLPMTDPVYKVELK